MAGVPWDHDACECHRKCDGLGAVQRGRYIWPRGPPVKHASRCQDRPRHIKSGHGDESQQSLIRPILRFVRPANSSSAITLWIPCYRATVNKMAASPHYSIVPLFVTPASISPIVRHLFRFFSFKSHLDSQHSFVIESWTISLCYCSLIHLSFPSPYKSFRPPSLTIVF